MINSIFKFRSRDCRVALLMAAFGLFLACYTLVLICGAHLGPIDDHTLLDTLQVGRRLGFFINPSLGRFYPLDAQEYNFVARCFGASPSNYYLFNGLEFLALIAAFWYLMRPLSSTIRVLALTYLTLVPGFAAAFSRLEIPERDSLFFFVLFLILYRSHQERPSWWRLCLGLIAANIAIYYKEPGFAAILALVLAHAGISWHRGERHLRAYVFDTALAISAMTFIALYYFIVYRHHGPHLYGEVIGNRFAQAIKNLLDYLLSDPLVAIGLPSIVGWRIWRVMRAGDRVDPLSDALLAAALAYCGVLLALNIFAVHYCLPVYAFLWASLPYNWPKPPRALHPVLASLGIVSVVLAVNSALTGVFTLCADKAIPRNYNQAIDHLVPALEGATHGTKPAVFLDGVNRASGVEIYESLGDFLAYEHVLPAQYKLCSDEAPDNTLLFQQNPSSPYLVFRTSQSQQVKQGDYLLITPFTKKTVNSEYLRLLSRDYTLVYRTKTPWALPDLNLRLMLKKILRKVTGHAPNFLGGDGQYPILDYFIYRKK